MSFKNGAGLDLDLDYPMIFRSDIDYLKSGM